MLNLLGNFLVMPPGMTGSNTIVLSFADQDDFDAAIAMPEKYDWELKKEIVFTLETVRVYERPLSFGGPNEATAALMVKERGEVVTFHMEI